MDEKIIEKISFLSRLSSINKDLVSDFEKILVFVDKIMDFNIENKEDKNKNIFSKELREDLIINKNENKIKDIINNFSNKEDEFCVVPLTIEKEKNDDVEKNNE